MKRSIWIGAVAAVVVLGSGALLLPRALENYYKGRVFATLDRLKTAGDEVDLSRYKQPPIPDDQNRGKQILLLAQPIVAMPQSLRDIQSRLDEVDPPEGTPPLTASDLQRLADFLRQSLPADDAFVAAAALPNTDWGHQHSLANADLSHLGPLRALANALAADARFAAHANDPDKFVRRVQQLHVVADVAGSDATVIGMLVQIGIDARAAHVVLDYPVALGSEQTRLLTSALLDDSLRNQRAQDSIELERAIIADLLLNPANSGVQTPRLMQLAMLRDRPSALDSITFVRDALLAPSTAQADRLIDQAATHNKAASLINLIYHTNLIPAVFRSRTDRRLAAVALAIRAFTAREGRLPHNIGELVPAYLESIPLDPLDPTDAPLRATAGLTVVYSVGRDRTDNQGDITPQPANYGSSPDPWTAPDRGFSTSPATQPSPAR